MCARICVCVSVCRGVALWCLYLKCLVIENFSQYWVDGCFIIIYALFGLVFKLGLCWKILYINCPFHIPYSRNGWSFTEKNSEFLCMVLKGEQDVGGCTHVYIAILIYTHHIARADSFINIETNALSAVQLFSIRGSIQIYNCFYQHDLIFQYKCL